MTNYVSFRAGPVGGAIIDPLLLTGTGGGLRPMTPQEVADAVTGRNLLFAVHGYNVNMATGISQLGQIGNRLALPPSASFFGVLWPGDHAVPVVSYPFEGGEAVQCGRRLARLCNLRFAPAASFSFVAHSLGARLVLEAVKGLDRKARAVCLAAAAVDRDALTSKYAAALANSEKVAVLSSVKDWVLQYIYPVGELLPALFGGGDSPFRSALGFKGPNPNAGPKVADTRIPGNFDCDHNDYMPQGPHWQNVAGYVRHCFEGTPQIWP